VVRHTPSALAAALLIALSLAACTAAPTPASTPSAAPSDAETAPASPGGAGILPGCDAIAPLVVALTPGLAFDADVSAAQTAPEAYDQSVCVWVSADGASQVTISVAAIPFLETELQAYGTLPNAIADDRLALHGAVLQTLQADDPADGHLDGPLYLFDLEYSVTIQGATTAGTVANALPQLTMASTVDAAFAVRELVR
jgi:hypothetical protein